ncbi:MAG: ARMT1-like domain-containing protein [Pseudomonadota bacterium]
MKLKPACIACNFNAALSTISEITGEDRVMKDLVAEVMQIPAMQGLDWDITGSDLVEEVFGRITAACGNPDPFRKTKQIQNERCIELYPWLRDLTAQSEHSLLTAVTLAIAANCIDPMGYQSTQDLEQVIRETINRPVSRERFAALQERLERAGRILYLGDNCGEIVFDKLLIQLIKAHYDVEVFFVVRSIPILNDATLTDAHFVGMGDVAVVVENGIQGPLPGTILSRCSGEVRSLWSSADLIISKGGGNFDTLDEQKNTESTICYMLMSKCTAYRDFFDIPPNSPILFMAAP